MNFETVRKQLEKDLAGFTIGEIAAGTGLGYQTVRKILNGLNKNPTIHSVQKLYDFAEKNKKG